MKRITTLLFSLAMVACIATSAYAQRVFDTANILTDQQKTALESLISSYETSSNNQLAVVIHDSLEGSDVTERAFEVASKMGIGHKDKNNGILLFMAMKEHKISIQVGGGLEGVYPDILTKHAIDDVKPLLKEGRYNEAITGIVKDIAQKTSKEYAAEHPIKKSFWAEHWLLILGIVAAIIILDIITFPWKNDLWMFGLLYLFFSVISGGGGSSGGFGGGGFSGGGSSGSFD